MQIYDFEANFIGCTGIFLRRVGPAGNMIARNARCMLICCDMQNSSTRGLFIFSAVNDTVSGKLIRFYLIKSCRVAKNSENIQPFIARYFGSAYFSSVKNPKSNIRNIIFDLGGVLIDLDLDRTIRAFSNLDIPVPTDPDELERRAVMYTALESGTISAALFREEIRELSPQKPSDEAIDAAWNAMLSGFPAIRVKVLQKLKENYRVFLLSNSNAIHHQCYVQRFKQDYALEMNSLFEQAYYSFEMKLCKPHLEIYQQVLEQSGLKPEETLFIDDNTDNVIAAAALGIIAHQLLPGEEIGDFFRDGILIKDETLDQL